MVSDSLEYDAPNMLITTDGDFTLTTPALSVSGKGLNANLSKEIFTMNSKVRAVHEAT
jgi:lipopolysaccharide export system protein LptC